MPLILWNNSGNDSTAAVGALYYIGSNNRREARLPASTWGSAG